MASLLRSALVFAVASSLIVLAAPACSDQAEGERCDRTKDGNAACDSGLTCVAGSELLVMGTDRCCPPEGQESSDRCTRIGSSGTAGSGSGGSNSSGSNTGGSAAGEPAGGGGSDGGTSGGDTGAAGEPPVGGAPNGEGGAPGAAGGESAAGAPLVTPGGQAGSP